VALTADATSEMDREIPALLQQMLAANQVELSAVISAFFTVTSDLTAEFPAAAARRGGWSEVPMMCAVEISVPGSLARVVRAMVHVESTLPRAQIRHIYRGGAQALRPDLPS
jgi:chorismate mutase